MYRARWYKHAIPVGEMHHEDRTVIYDNARALEGKRFDVTVSYWTGFRWQSITGHQWSSKARAAYSGEMYQERMPDYDRTQDETRKPEAPQDPSGTEGGEKGVPGEPQAGESQC